MISHFFKLSIICFYITSFSQFGFSQNQIEGVSSFGAIKILGKIDVDINIPITSSKAENVYVLAIGNEDYASYQTGISKESNVDFAANDAKIFSEYCIKTLGVPERQVKVLINATSAQIKQGLAWLSDLAAIEGGNAILYFYYSGHGLPHEGTKEPYLIPVDVNGGQIELAIPLKTIYSSLNKNPIKKGIVILDACFSGGARNQPLITAKAVRVRPREPLLSDNILVISSSTGEESSGIYSDKQHGFFTYFLLKKLQESKGKITYGELFDYVNRNVLKETAISGKKQTPVANSGASDIWKDWVVIP
ncbi:MAG: caspase family protein [Candidatus Moranbacteria bacterium]|jgi:hypothetical protein|nr:caspase family protein [Candidatus Moranbacteria bacterium]